MLCQNSREKKLLSFSSNNKFIKTEKLNAAAMPLILIVCDLLRVCEFANKYFVGKK
jgi:hypothetical protein